MTPSTLPKAESVLKDALALITGPRQESYGHPSRNLGDIASMWSILFGIEVSPRQVCLAMALLKISRDKTTQKRDNIDDAVGYLALAEEVSPDRDTGPRYIVRMDEDTVQPWSVNP